MEQAWQDIIQPRNENAWVDGIVFGTKTYYRYLVQSGTLWQWNNAAGTWTQITGSAPAGLTQVSVRY